MSARLPRHILDPFGVTGDGWAPDAPTLYTVTIDGTEYVTDRYMLIRRECVVSIPTAMIRDDDLSAQADKFAEWLAEPPVERDDPPLLHPMYVAVLPAAAGYTLAATAGDRYLIRDGQTTVGVVQRMKVDSPGALPGDDLTATRRAYDLILEYGLTEDHRAAWQAAWDIAQEVAR